MDKRHMPRQCHIHIHIGNVQYQKHQIESTQQLVGQIDILWERLSAIVSSIEWVGRHEYRRTCIQGSVDSGIGDALGRIFHDFMDGGSIRLVHSIQIK